MTTLLRFCAVLLLIPAIHVTTVIADSQVYKHVDENGKVTYSEIPPSEKGETKQINVSPSLSSTGGYPINKIIIIHHYSSNERNLEAMQERQKIQNEAKQKRMDDLKAECNRDRGTDCDDPNALRYLEATKIPRGTHIAPQ
jgi:hypothetical protein